MIHSLVFAGCGLAGISYLGVLRFLEEKGLMSDISYFAGASSGSFVATMAACGYTSDQLQKLLNEIQLNKITDPWYKWIYNLFCKGGFNTTERMRSKLEQCLLKIGLSKDLTFGELYNDRGKCVTVVVTDMKNKKPIYIHPFTHPDTRIVDALLQSLSVPIFFTSSCYMDGGITDNYPVWIYNDIDVFKKGDFGTLQKLKVPHETLGVKVKNRIRLFTRSLNYTMDNEIVIPYSGCTLNFNDVSTERIQYLSDVGYKSSSL